MLALLDMIAVLNALTNVQLLKMIGRGIAEVMVARLWLLWWNICIITKIFIQWRRPPLITQVDIGAKINKPKPLALVSGCCFYIIRLNLT